MRFGTVCLIITYWKVITGLYIMGHRVNILGIMGRLDHVSNL